MKLVQKLEIAFGVLTFLATLVVCYLTLSPIVLKSDHLDIVLRTLISGFIFCVPACLVAFGSIHHASRRGQGGFVVLLIAGLILITLFAFSFLGVNVYLGLRLAVLFTSPAFLAVITLFFAFRVKSVPVPLK